MQKLICVKVCVWHCSRIESTRKEDAVNSDNQTALKESERQLLQLRDAVRDAIRTQLHRDDNPELLTLANHIIDGCDWTEADVLNDTDIALLRQKIERLREIDMALRRIGQGSYGVCRSCSRPIPAQRMLAEPACEYCIDCQNRIEGTRHAHVL